MTVIDSDLLDILACPENKTPVKLADQPLIDAINSAIEKGEVQNRGEQKVEQPIDGGVGREANPIVEGVSMLRSRLDAVGGDWSIESCRFIVALPSQCCASSVVHEPLSRSGRSVHVRAESFRV